jgi:hypothetical protein
MKIHPLKAELFHADGRTDMKKLIVSFRNFPKVPNNGGAWGSVVVKALRY